MTKFIELEIPEESEKLLEQIASDLNLTIEEALDHILNWYLERAKFKLK